MELTRQTGYYIRTISIVSSTLACDTVGSVSSCFSHPLFLQDCEECIRLDPNFSESKFNHNQAVGVNSISILGYRKGKQGGGGGQKRQLQNWGGGQGGEGVRGKDYSSIVYYRRFLSTPRI